MPKKKKKTQEQKTANQQVNTITNKQMEQTLLFEVAWEVCNQLGGIYTVIRSKVPSVVDRWPNKNYILIGPFLSDNVLAEFDDITDEKDAIGAVVASMRKKGYDIRYGHWLVSGRPRTILFNPYSVYNQLDKVKYEMWESHHIALPTDDDLLNKVSAFSYLVREFFRTLCSSEMFAPNMIAHFHEWMVGPAIPGIRKENMPIKTVFTTHATILGRYLAQNDPVFYDHLPFYNWAKEADHFNIRPIVEIERAAAHGAHVFTTVSEITAQECIHLLGRKPDVILPNGLNIERFEAMHHFQQMHLTYKEQIHEFVMGHFFQNYSFDLENTLYFFTSGRFEYENKGYDITLEALARLNWRMKEAGMNTTVVAFLITRQPFHSFNPTVLHTKALMEEIRRNCEEIEQQVGRELFYSVAALPKGNYKFPNTNALVADFLKLKLRRNVQSWKTQLNPPVVTHNMVDDSNDKVLNFLRTSGLVNHESDKVKIVYHPDFISPSNPLFRMEYQQFVRGCHLGVFPSYYEPWGYTPLECMASGIPSVTSDLAGFGSFVDKNIPGHNDMGVYIVNRKQKSFNEAAQQLADLMFDYASMSRRERITQRNTVEGASVQFDWKELGKYYDEAYAEALKR